MAPIRANLLQDTFIEVRKCMLYLGYVDTRDNHRSLQKSLESFDSAIQQATLEQKELFIGQHLRDLGTVIKTLSTTRGSMISELKRSIVSHLPLPGSMQFASILFLDFITGITYFTSQSPSTSHPFYHRSASCGPFVGQSTFRNKHKICDPTKPKKSRQSRREVSERCYIERQIFNEIFLERERYITSNDPLYHFEYVGTDAHPGSQDNGHKRALDEAKTDFETCCPSCEIKVEVHFGARAAESVVIQRFQRGRLLSTERYIRRIVDTGYYGRGWVYDPLVSCFKEASTQMYYKVQDVAHEAAWQKLKRGRKALSANNASLENIAKRAFDTISAHSV